MLRYLANEVFPAVATAQHYPIVRNHCFLRVVYDQLMGQQWQKVLSARRPAIHQLSDEQLTEALQIGSRIIGSKAVCEQLNRQSLAWRHKLKEA